MLLEAIESWHALLSDEMAQESQAQLEAQLRRRGLFFGDRPLCTVLRPRFLTADQYRILQDDCAATLSAFRTAHAAALADPRVLDQFGLEPWERELLSAPAGIREPSPVSRLDAFFVDEGRSVRFTEYNAETPAGSAYNDVLAEVFYALPIMREFQWTWDVRPIPARHHVLHALLGAYRQWALASGADTKRLPRIAIVDWREVPTWSEFLLFQDYFTRQGLECVIADPRSLSFENGRLLTEDGQPIDLVYKRVLLNELYARDGLDGAVLSAVRAGAVCMVNPPACKILHKKSSLAVLSDERNAHLFSRAQQVAIAEHIPWTRVVENRRTTAGGRTVDLLAHISAQRTDLVLKPHDDYGGAGIVLGWEVDQATWDASIRAALDTPYIVQQRIPLPKEPYPTLVDGKVVLLDRMVDTAPYVAHGAHVDGCLTRLSTASLLNVTHGGGSQTPTFLVERR